MEFHSTAGIWLENRRFVDLCHHSSVYLYDRYHLPVDHFIVFGALTLPADMYVETPVALLLLRYYQINLSSEEVMWPEHNLTFAILDSLLQVLSFISRAVL